MGAVPRGLPGIGRGGVPGGVRPRPDPGGWTGEGGDGVRFDEYARGTREWFAAVAGSGGGLGIELRFTERIAAGGPASERGVFRITATRPGAEDKLLHGRFHTFSRKSGGRWRIVADYDSDDDGTVTEEVFEAAGRRP
ncbi:hypothetical protein [Umezawaea tangerina]|uniref:DUF4440 domain-containing protein n=1 Tax=Umezawaea tangerina TaxID=84725 RepID=A0A2T0TGM2_9PSEU|nr:hypothetical protein [Umezawaea tangerina]PRY44852.1 hypothetical protein CLV43_102417 [Umezawaea tangerina]